MLADPTIQIAVACVVLSLLVGKFPWVLRLPKDRSSSEYHATVF